MTKVNFFPDYHQHKTSTAKQKTADRPNSFLSAINLTVADKESNWRTMSNESWDKMLKNMDEVIDAWKERLKLLREAQLKAAGEAARLAPAAYQSMAAQSAWNAVAMLGILSPTGDSNISLAANAAMLANSIEKVKLQTNDSEYF